MPLYDYHCTACAADFELLVRTTGDRPTVPTCPHCASTALERALSRIAPAGRTAGLLAAGRRAAAREGHFSNYGAADRAKASK